MIIEVNRQQLLKIIRNIPGGGSYEWVIDAQKRNLGYLSGGFKEEWCWNHDLLEGMTDDKLLDLFNELNPK